MEHHSSLESFELSGGVQPNIAIHQSRHQELSLISDYSLRPGDGSVRMECNAGLRDVKWSSLRVALPGDAPYGQAMANLTRLSFPLSVDRNLDHDFMNILGGSSNDS